MGFKMMWNSKAIVIEEKIIKRKFFLVLKRNFRYGASSNIIYKKAYGLVIGLSFLVAKLILDSIMLIFSFLGLITFTRKSFYKFSMYFCRILGLIFGLLGFQYYEYS